MTYSLITYIIPRFLTPVQEDSKMEILSKKDILAHKGENAAVETIRKNEQKAAV